MIEKVERILRLVNVGFEEGKLDALTDAGIKYLCYELDQGNRPEYVKGISVEAANRNGISREIIDRTVDALLAAGYSLSVYDSEEVTVEKSKDARAIKLALMTTDDDRLLVHTEEEPRSGFVWFIYGNDGPDVIGDYTVNLEAALTPVNEYADTF